MLAGLRLNPSSGVPIYIQLIERVKHAIEIGVLKPGDQLPPYRKLAEELVANPNTVAKAYRELEVEGVIELRQGSGAFVSAAWSAHVRTKAVQRARTIIQRAVIALRRTGISEGEARRLLEMELSDWRESIDVTGSNYA
jgi:GntR family transcriptional regulator